MYNIVPFRNLPQSGGQVYDLFVVRRSLAQNYCACDLAYTRW